MPKLPKGFIEVGDMAVGAVPIEKLVQRRTNYRKMGDAEMETLKESIGRAGFKTFILVGRGKKRGTYEVLDGHHRWQAAKELEMSEVPVVLYDGSDDDKDLAMLSMNVTAEILPDVYMEFLSEMEERVGAEELAKFTALDSDFLAELTEAAKPDQALLDELSSDSEIEETTDRSRGESIAVVLPRQAAPLLAAAQAHWGVVTHSEAVMESLKQQFERADSGED